MARGSGNVLYFLVIGLYSTSGTTRRAFYRRHELQVLNFYQRRQFRGFEEKVYKVRQRNFYRDKMSLSVSTWEIF